MENRQQTTHPMKSIPNNITTIKNGEGFIKYSDLLKAVLNVTPQGGFSISDIKTRLKLHSIMDNATDSIQMEDAEYNYLKPLLGTMRWGILNQEIINLTEDFNNAEKL